MLLMTTPGRSKVNGTASSPGNRTCTMLCMRLPGAKATPKKVISSGVPARMNLVDDNFERQKCHANPIKS